MKTSTIALLLILFLTGASLNARPIPNNSFETWSRDTVDLFGTPIMFDHPVGWAPLASLFNTMYGLGEIGLYQSTAHHGSGSYSALFEAGPSSPQKSTTRFWVDNLSYGGTSHIAKEVLSEIRLIQDPAASMVSLEWRAEPGINYTVEIYSLTGRLIESQERVSGRATFSLAALPRGLYIIRLTDGRQVHARKFVH